MTAKPTTGSLEGIDLLPPSFRYENRVRQVVCSWLTVICALVAILSGVSVATIFRVHQERQTNQQLAATAIPLMDLRRDVCRLQRENNQRDQWCRLADAARPADDLLQTLAAISAASQTPDRAIMIDSLDVRQAIEFPESAKQTPPWATGRIVIQARMPAEAIRPWLDRLVSSDRVEAASTATESDFDTNSQLRTESSFLRDEAQPINITATPLSTRVLP